MRTGYSSLVCRYEPRSFRSVSRILRLGPECRESPLAIRFQRYAHRVTLGLSCGPEPVPASDILAIVERDIVRPMRSGG